MSQANNVETLDSAQSKTVEALKNVLADSYALYVKTQNYHWNVTGPQFHSLHVMFEEQYTDLFAAIDEIAERIRALGAKVPASLTVFSDDKSIQSGSENDSAQTMVKHLAEDQHTVVGTLQKALTAAEAANDDATADMIIERITVHQKNAWMLNSTLGN